MEQDLVPYLLGIETNEFVIIPSDYTNKLVKTIVSLFSHVECILKVYNDYRYYL